MVDWVNDTMLFGHAEEAAYQWIVRDQAALAPNYSLLDLHDVDEKIEAHLDGLRIAKAAGWEFCEEQLEFEEPGEVFAAAFLAFEARDRGRYERVVEVLRAVPEVERAFVSALCWIGAEQARPWWTRFVAVSDPLFNRVGLATASLLRQDVGGALQSFLASDDPLLRGRAFKAAGELGRRDVAPYLDSGIGSDDQRVRFYAAWSGGLLGHTSSPRTLMEIASSASRFAERAGETAARCLPQGYATDWLRSLINEKAPGRVALRIAGAIGNPALIPWIIDQMKDESLARIAGEAVTTITGVDLAFEDLDTDAPEEDDSDLSDEDDDIQLDEDEDVPWPDPQSLRAWWEARAGSFDSGLRHLCGAPIEKDHLETVLRRGTQRQRTAASFELARLQNGRPLFNTEAQGRRQLEALGLDLKTVRWH